MWRTSGSTPSSLQVTELLTISPREHPAALHGGSWFQPLVSGISFFRSWLWWTPNCAQADAAPAFCGRHTRLVLLNAAPALVNAAGFSVGSCACLWWTVYWLWRPSCSPLFYEQISTFSWTETMFAPTLVFWVSNGLLILCDTEAKSNSFPTPTLYPSQSRDMKQMVSSNSDYHSMSSIVIGHLR